MEEKIEHSRNQSPGLIKVVLFGPESTGKTTLAKQLAQYYNTLWVPEYMRKYLEDKWAKKEELIAKEDLIPIAKGQLESENRALQKVEKLLICDTDLLQLKVYSEYYYKGFVPEEILNSVKAQGGRFYLLTYVDIPWERDILRDRPHNREEMFHIFETELKLQNLPYKILKGTEDERMKMAIETVDGLFKTQKKQ